LAASRSTAAVHVVPPITPLVIAALAFAVITGANDGASLVGTNLASKAFTPAAAVALLVVAVILGPFLLGTAVATTLARGLVGFEGSNGDAALLVAVIVAVGLVYGVGHFGLPTSVTQALTGAIIGVGFGAGLPVDVTAAVRVVVVLILAPVVAGVLAYGIARMLAAAGPHGPLREHLRRLHLASYAAQCVAYAANDAQKMIAVLAVAIGFSSSTVPISLPTQLAIGGLFAVGLVIRLPVIAGRLGSRLFIIRPLNAISAGTAASAVVLGSAAIGSPVSMAQASTASLLGSESALETYRRVRWEQAVRIGAAWIVTLPLALVVAALLGAVFLRSW
jgi:PiT family inorganic phosphate transporter